MHDVDDAYDVIIIGGGLLGCFAARNLARYDLRIALVEARSELCCGLSKANSAIVYAGYDMHPGTLKAALTVASNRRFSSLCAELGVRYKQCGSLMVAFGPKGMASIEHKFEQGRANGLDDLEVLDSDRTLEMEPYLADDVQGSLWSPTVGTVMPWELAYAAAGNAADNGVTFLFDTKVNSIERDRTTGTHCVKADNGLALECRALVNCAGLFSDEIAALTGDASVRIVPTKADYIVIDEESSSHIRHVLFHEQEERRKGLTVVPCLDGHALLGPSEAPAYDKNDTGCSEEGLSWIEQTAKRVIPGIDGGRPITTFASLRPNPYRYDPEAGGDGLIGKEHRSIRDFSIVRSEDNPGMISLIGIKTPGLTCADGLGRHIASLIVDYLGDAAPNPFFSPTRPASERFRDIPTGRLRELVADDPAWERLVCQCEQVTEAEVIAAIRDGAVTVDGVKRRCGAGMGACQGTVCMTRVMKILARELGRPFESIRKDDADSWLVSTKDDFAGGGLS